MIHTNGTEESGHAWDETWISRACHSARMCRTAKFDSTSQCTHLKGGANESQESDIYKGFEGGLSLCCVTQGSEKSHPTWLLVFENCRLIWHLSSYNSHFQKAKFNLELYKTQYPVTFSRFSKNKMDNFELAHLSKQNNVQQHQQLISGVTIFPAYFTCYPWF